MNISPEIKLELERRARQTRDVHERLRMRERKMYNKCYLNFAEFTEAIRCFFWEDVPKMTDILKQRINDKFQRIQLNTIQPIV